MSISTLSILLAHCISTQFTQSQQPAGVDDIFYICSLLNEYGCNSPSIPDLVRIFINQYTPDYYLPTDRCEFDTINLTQIAQSADLSLLSQVDASILSELPCEILVQLPSEILHEKQIAYLVDYAYWFDDNDAYLACNASLAIDCNGNHTQNTSSTDTPASRQECYLGRQCLYPFVASDYIDDYPMSAGMCHCGLDCRLRPYKYSLRTLDATMLALFVITYLFLLIYCINVGSECIQSRRERRLARQQMKSDDATKPSLLNDIPILVGCWLLLFLLSYSLPPFLGRQHFVCEDGSLYRGDDDGEQLQPKARVFGSSLPQASGACFVSGLSLYLSLTMISLYLGLLSLAIYRYVAHPLKPLWGCHRHWFHACLWLYGLLWMALWIHYDVISPESVTSICGPNLYITATFVCTMCTSLISLVVFVVFTPLNVYHIQKRIRYAQSTTSARNAQSQSRDFHHLYQRIVLYSVIVSAATVCLVYVFVSYYSNKQLLDELQLQYLQCLFTAFQLRTSAQRQQEIIAAANIFEAFTDECQFDPAQQMDQVHSFHVLMVVSATLIGFASVTFSCSLKKYRQWKAVCGSVASRCGCRAFECRVAKRTPTPLQQNRDHAHNKSSGNQSVELALKQNNNNEERRLKIGNDDSENQVGAGRNTTQSLTSKHKVMSESTTFVD